MKSLTRSFLGLTVAALLATGALLAQSAENTSEHHMRGGNSLAFLSNHLNLTDAQQAQAKTIFQTEHQNAKPVMEQLRQERQAIEQAIQAGKSSDELTQLAAAQGPLLGQLAGIHAVAQAQLYSLLTPDQQEKLSSLRQRWQGHQGGEEPRQK